MTLTYTTVTNDSYRTSITNVPAHSAGPLVSGHTAGERIKVQALRPDDKTAMVAVGDKGSVLWASSETVTALMDSGVVVSFWQGDKLNILNPYKYRIGPVPVVEFWHDTSEWNEGFEGALAPYVSIPVVSAKAAESLMEWAESHGVVTDSSGDVYTFNTRVKFVKKGAALRKKDAKKLVTLMLNAWDGI